MSITTSMTALVARLKNTKTRQSLVVSAGSGQQSGIHTLYLGFENDGHSILAKAFLPYPQNIGELLATISESGVVPSLKELATLDHKLTMLFADAAKNTLAGITNSSIVEPHYIVLNKPVIFKGEVSENLQQTSWDISLGDEQYLASTFKVPVMSNFLRHNVLAGGSGTLPAFPGSLIAAKNTTGIGIFVNIGNLSHVIVLNGATGEHLCSTDVGPGTIAIDKCARSIDKTQGFDRDGKLALGGKPDAERLETLSKEAWFQKPAPKQATPDMFANLASHPCLKGLNDIDKLATVTAFTAKCIYDFYRREYREAEKPEALWVSGGAVNNLALMEFLKASFDPIPVRNVEELNIPTDMKIPLTLGLTVDEFVCGKKVLWETGESPRISPLGRWVFP